MFSKKQPYHVLGMMSGTSLDGLDLAFCRLWQDEQGWQYLILYAETMPWDENWQRKIHEAFYLQGHALIKFHFELGHEMGKRASTFIHKYQIQPDFIASHGQTLFHEPTAGYTFQAGSGAAIAAQTRLPVVCDFRSLDVALGGQGAPLVPIGDSLLFSNYGACLNLGGFANISYKDVWGRRLAYDICPANMALNHLASLLGQSIDIDGRLASRGRINKALLQRLQQLEYFWKTPPKSLGREWFENEFLPLLHQYKIPPGEALRTVSELISLLVKKAVDNIPERAGGVLVTGGGAHNSFLLHLMQEKHKLPIVVPDSLLIDFKEALIFAFLGVLYVEGQPNCLKDVTGAASSSIGGCLYQGRTD